MHIDIVGYGGKYTVYYNGEMHCSSYWRWSLQAARWKYYRTKFMEVYKMLDKNGVKISKGKAVHYEGEEFKVQWARGRKLILTNQEHERPLHAHVKSLRDRIVNVEVIQ